MVAFLRGINVGGHHKVPMAVLRDEMTAMGFGSVRTLLNSGNVIFESDETNLPALEQRVETRLQAAFGFPIPVLIRMSASMVDLVESDPFKDIEIHADIRLYITFTRSGDNIPSVLDLRDTQTTKEMEQLEKRLGKDITTRNWNTIVKMVGR